MSKSLSSVPEGFMVPIEVDAEYSSSKILIMLLVVGVLVGVVLWLYYRSTTKNTSSVDEKYVNYVQVIIHNVTNTEQRIETEGNKSFTIEPQQTGRVSVPYGSILKASSFSTTGELIKDVFTASGGDIYITPSGLTPASNVSMGVKLVNASKYPVLFVERGKDGKRMWGSNIVPPGSYENRDYVGTSKIWHVYHPTDENHPIASVISGNTNKQLVFNGKTLISE